MSLSKDEPSNNGYESYLRIKALYAAKHVVQMGSSKKHGAPMSAEKRGSKKGIPKGPMPDETRRKIRDALFLNNPIRGTHRSEETIRKIKATLKGHQDFLKGVHYNGKHRLDKLMKE